MFISLEGSEGAGKSSLIESLIQSFKDANKDVKKIIYPAIDKGIHVLTDRYIDSTYAYQGAGRGINEDVLNYLFKMLNFPIPDLTIFLDIPVVEGLERVKSRGEMDRFEEEEISFFERIRESYLFRSKQEPERFFVIKMKFTN